MLVAQLWLTLYDPMDCSALGFSVHEIFQTRILEWAAILEWPQSNKPKTPSAGKHVEQQVLPFSAGERQRGTVTLEESFATFYKTNIRSLSLVFIPNCVCTKACTQICIVALFIITRTWKRLQCPS